MKTVYVYGLKDPRDGLINAAANRIGLPFSTWSRMRLLEVARAELATTRRDNAILEIVHDSVI
jgi:hypothetical protein